MTLEEYKDKVRQAAERMWNLDDKDRAYMEEELKRIPPMAATRCGWEEEAYLMFL